MWLKGGGLLEVDASRGCDRRLATDFIRNHCHLRERLFAVLFVNPLLTVGFIASSVPHGEPIMLMLKLMIECSRTGRLVETGIETDRRSFQSLADFQAKTFCPYCNRHHVWSKEEVCVEAAYPFECAAGDTAACH